MNRKCDKEAQSKLTTHEDGTRTLEMSQPDYIESMYHRWRDYLPRRYLRR